MAGLSKIEGLKAVGALAAAGWLAAMRWLAFDEQYTWLSAASVLFVVAATAAAGLTGKQQP